jgi:glyoxalase family protein
MVNKIFGLHHITAIAASAQRNYDFYTGVMGLRLVKKTVNFDDPETYHFYFGDETGSPGTLLTFFPWEWMVPGRPGPGMATNIGYSVPGGSVAFWMQRFTDKKVKYDPPRERFGELFLAFEDPDGLRLELVFTAEEDKRKPWETAEIKADAATRGFRYAVLTVRSMTATARLLTEVLGYHLAAQDGNRYRFATDAVDGASIIDLIEMPTAISGNGSAGTIHHLAFRVKNEDALMEYHDIISDMGLQITPKIDRDYFYSVYFREPGGVLFEFATENPGFAIDEPVDRLGTGLQLPKQLEPYRTNITKALKEIV